MGAHSQNKKEELQKEKSHCSDLFLVGADQTPPRQHPKFIFSKSDASKKGRVHKHRHCPDFHPGESPRSQNNVFNKDIARHNQ
jgi:hypothetical protein